MPRKFVTQNRATLPGVSATVQLEAALAEFRAFLGGALTNGAQAVYYLIEIE